jgi:hypothetical protein
MRRILLLIATLAALSGCGWRHPASVRIDPALATLVPRDTLLLAGIRVEALRATPLYQKIGAETISGLVSGLDLKNIWEILAASNGGEMAILARGKFASAGLEPEIALPGASRTSYLGYTLIGNDRTALVFLNPSTALAGQPEVVKRILDERGNSTGPPRPLSEEIAQIAPDSQIWAAGMGGSGQLACAVPQGGNLGNIATALKLVERFRVAADLRSGAKISAVALCRSERDAESLGGALQVFLALARMGNPGFRSATDAIRIEQQQSTVRLEASIPEEPLESLLPAGPAL